MSPGTTFERVYLALKAQLAEGMLEAGARLEPAPLGEALHSSITPVRDALYRLVGERLVDAPRNEGFRVPLLTEADLRDLYAWHGLLLGLALRGHALAADPILPPDSADMTEATAAIFAGIAGVADSVEQATAIVALGERLAPFRRAELIVLEGMAAEFDGLASAAAAGDVTVLRRAIRRYHRRREQETPRILAARQQRKTADKTIG